MQETATDHGSDSIAAVSAVHDQCADTAGHSKHADNAAAVCLSVDIPLPESRRQRQTDVFAAVAAHLSIQQRVLIGRVLRCIVTMTEHDSGQCSKQTLLPWLVIAVTSGCGASDELTEQQKALLSMLQHFACSSSSLQTLTAASCQLPSVSAQNTAAVSQGTATASVAKLQPAKFQHAAATGLRQLSGEGASAQHNSIAAQTPSSSHAETICEPAASNKLDREVHQSHEDSCMWLHQRLTQYGKFRNKNTRSNTV